MKKRNIFVSCFLSLLMSLSFILPSIISSKNSIKLRSIDVNELGTLSYEEKAEQILEIFDEYDYSENDDRFTFKANIDVSSQDTTSLEFLDDNSEKTTKNFVLDFDYENEKYYVAIADTVDGFLYVSDIALSDEEALAVLTTSTFVTGATANKKGIFPQLVVSLYTPNWYDAYLIACAAGTILGNPGATHHTANRIGYYNHYHPGEIYLDTSKPHVFYGQAL